MDLVNHVDLVRRLGGTKPNLLQEVPNIVHAGV